jgi:hypothetical protein
MEEIKGLGHKDALLVLSTIANDESADIAYRVTAASSLAPFQHPKLASLPTPRYIDEPIQLPEPTTIEQANKNIAYISNLKAQGLIDLDFANSLIADNTTIANNLIAEEELKFKISPPSERDQTITIEGGLPALPGTNITMPVLNGHAVSEQLLSAPTDVVPPEAPNELTPAELKAQGPHPLQKHHFAAPEAAPGTNSNGQGPPTQGDEPVWPYR